MRRLVILMALSLAACSEPEVLLEGERLDVDGNPIKVQSENRAAPLSLPRAVVNGEWTHAGGNVRHQLSNVALDRELNLAWSADIGEGNTRRFRITADPVVSGGRVFVMDSRSRVSAFSTSGAPLWSAEITPPGDRADEAGGGGLAVSGGTLYVTSGFGTLTAMDAATGGVRWTHDFDAAATGAPTVSGGVIYAVTSNATGWAIDARSGRILWQALGAAGDRGIAGGGPSPAVAGPLVVFPFSSGQMVAAAAGEGNQTWAASVAGGRLGHGFSAVTDLTGGPVVVGNTIYAATHAGRAGAFDGTTGRNIWRAEEGTSGQIWAAGGSLFFVTDDNRLVRLDAATGGTVWAQNLPLFTRSKIKRRKSTFVHYGPVMANGQLILVSDDGMLRRFDPVSGALTGQQELPDGAARNPVIAGGTLYLVTENGRLHAFR